MSEDADRSPGDDDRGFDVEDYPDEDLRESRDGDPEDRSGDADTGEADADGSTGEGEGEREDDAWRFDVDEVDEEGIVRSAIEPGRPDPENALFVVLGAIAMVLVFVQLWLLLS